MTFEIKEVAAGGWVKAGNQISNSMRKKIHYPPRLKDKKY